jgi:hypothetical protein
METIKPIGGYFELEIGQGKDFMHSTATMWGSGRIAEEVVLRSLFPISKLWIPFFTCQVVLEPIKKLNISYDFYHIDRNLEIAQEVVLGKDEYLLYTNYLGIKDEYVAKLASKYKDSLIVDNAQALYAMPVNYLNAIYSPRKFVGIPDGGIAYSSRTIEVDEIAVDSSYDRCSHLLKRLDCDPSFGYNDFRDNAQKLSSLPVLQMSKLTKALLMSVDYMSVKEKRRRNFEFLHGRLKNINQFNMPQMSSFSCPLVYPFLPLKEGLKQFLISNKVFVATYWPNVLEWCKEGDIEYEMAQRIVHLPIDQRYDQTDMERIINLINVWKSQFDR